MKLALVVRVPVPAVEVSPRIQHATLAGNRPHRQSPRDRRVFSGMPSFADTMATMAVFSDEDMGRSWKWGSEGSDLGVRDGFHRSLEVEMAHLAIIESGAALTEPIVAMAEAQRALGRALGLVTGQPAELLDFQPAPGDWPLREVMRHMIETELSFFVNTRWSVTRTKDQPV